MKLALNLPALRVRDRRHTRRRALFAGTAAFVLLAGVSVPGGQAAPTEGSAEPPAWTPGEVAPADLADPAGAAEEAVTITLITGDTVLYTERDGEDPSIVVDLAPDSGTQEVDVLTGPDGVYVIPDQAWPLIDADALDRGLFDVRYLADNGYADDDADTLPLIVTYDEPEAGLRSAEPDAAALAERTSALAATASEPVGLSSINGSAVDVDKESAEDFWAQVRDVELDDPALRTHSGTEFAAGIDKIWLDRKVSASMEDSRSQIGAPEAWDLGVDGSGATVAVLDSGYDTSHPDFAGQVSDVVSFVPDDEVQDRGGHGTHVASIVAGSGAASDGRYAGVAPGADLAIGKVLNDAGQGQNSWIIAGMEWAAENADVVNMSLGSFPTDGTDPMSLAVDNISAETGTLFVIAAGNFGPAASTVTTPATAESALAVASVDMDDEIAGTSSRGPRVGDHALKPEIAAPGNPVVAAWSADADASNGVPVGEHYIAYAGTSMASPQVAGVAAMLVQQHPGWGGELLKDALMSTSYDAGHNLYHQGAGRVDAARATSQDLFATGKADFGRFPHPVPDGSTEIRTITYTNTGDTDTTVDLEIEVDSNGTPFDKDALTLSATTVDVPAGGQADVELTLAAENSTEGQFAGHVRGAGSDGAEVATAVAYVVDPPTYELTVETTDRFGGTPVRGRVIVHDATDRDRYYEMSSFDASGRAVFEVPAGDYVLQGSFSTADSARPNLTYSTDVFVASAMDVGADHSVHIDGTEASDVEFDVRGENRSMEPVQITQSVHHITPDEERISSSIITRRTGSDARFGAVPSTEPPVGTQYVTTLARFQESLIRARVDDAGAALATVTPEWTGRFDGQQDLDLVDAGLGRAVDYERIDAEGKLVLVESGDGYVAEQAETAAAHGAAAMLVVPDAPGVAAVSVASGNTLPVVGTTHDEGMDLRARLGDGPVGVRLTGVSESSFTYTLRAEEAGSISSDLSRTLNRSDLAVIENSFHSGADRLGGEALSVYADWQGGAVTSSTQVNQPTQRTDYVSAGEGIRQEQFVRTAQGITSARLAGAPVSYQPRERVRTSWFKAPNHPSGYTPLPCNFCRSDAVLRFAPATLGDAEPTHSGSGRFTTQYATHHDDELIDRPELLLVPEPATYRIEQVAEAIPDEEHVLGNRSETAWTFRSEAPAELEVEGCREVLAGAGACAALPVIVLGYDLPLELDNSAPAGRTFHFEVRTDRAKGYTGPSRVAGLEVSLSFDGGATWQEAQTMRQPRGDGFRVRASHPKIGDTDGFVSLRVEAWDDDGNRTVQTIERAYALS